MNIEQTSRKLVERSAKRQMASYLKDCSRSMDCSITSQKGLFCGMSESSMPESEEMKCMCTTFQGAFDMGMSMMNFPCMGKKKALLVSRRAHTIHILSIICFDDCSIFLCNPICIFLSSYFLDNTDACLPLLPQ